MYVEVIFQHLIHSLSRQLEKLTEHNPLKLLKLAEP